MPTPRATRSAVLPGTVKLDADWQIVLRRQMEPAFGAAADTMATEARRLVPVDTGELKASIRSDVIVQGIRLAAVCVATAPHADFVEYGTGQRGAKTFKRGAMRVDKPVEYQHGPKPGMRAQPYLRPAMVAAARLHFAYGVR